MNAQRFMIDGPATAFNRFAALGPKEDFESEFRSLKSLYTRCFGAEEMPTGDKPAQFQAMLDKLEDTESMTDDQFDRLLKFGDAEI